MSEGSWEPTNDVGDEESKRRRRTRLTPQNGSVGSRNGRYTPSSIGRRPVLSGVLGSLLLAGCLSGDGSDSDDGDGDADGDDDDAATATVDAEPPFELRTVEAPGSDGEPFEFPSPGTVTVCHFTRTNCPTNAGHLSIVADAHGRIEDDRVRFCSILEPRRDPLSDDDGFAEWWIEHDGEWTLAVDEEKEAVSYFDATSPPKTFVIDERGDRTLEAAGDESAGDIVRAVEDALAELDEASSTDQ